MEPNECAAESSNKCSSSCGSSRGNSCSNKIGGGCGTKESGSDESAGPSENPREGGPALLDLPREIITHIFGFLNYDEIAQLRPVCKVFDDICKNLLNEGFYKLGEFHSESLKKIKAQLPRRESERRSHRLARHGDILTAIETRLNLLSMTYGKFIDQNLCCFIPGRVIDEVRRIIRLVNINRETRKDIARSHEVLQELRDISSMAMEHFEECIQPRLRAKISDRLSGGIADPLIAVANMAIVEANDTVLGFRPGFRIAAGSPIAPHYTGSVYQTLGDQSRKLAKLESKTKELEKRDREKDKKLQEYKDQLASTTASVGKLIGRIAELEKQLIEARGTVREESCEVSTSRGTRFTQKRDSNDLESCELQPRPKRGRRDKK